MDGDKPRAAAAAAAEQRKASVGARQEDKRQTEEERIATIESEGRQTKHKQAGAGEGRCGWKMEKLLKKPEQKGKKESARKGDRRGGAEIPRFPLLTSPCTSVYEVTWSKYLVVPKAQNRPRTAPWLTWD